MNRLLSWMIIVCMVLAVSCVHAEEKREYTGETIQIPAMGEKAEEAKVSFSDEGFTCSIYGMERTEDTLLVHAHLKNDTDHALGCMVSVFFPARGSVIGTVTMNSYSPDTFLEDLVQLEPHQEADVTLMLKSEDSYMKILGDAFRPTIDEMTFCQCLIMTMDLSTYQVVYTITFDIQIG